MPRKLYLRIPCPVCKGHEEIDCPACRGTGYDFQDGGQCEVCDGTGEIVCPKCDGDGYILVEDDD